MTALNESNATIAAATKAVRVDVWRFIDGSFSLDMNFWLAAMCELSMCLRNRYSTARRGGYSPPYSLDHKRGRGIPAPTRGTVPDCMPEGFIDQLEAAISRTPSTNRSTSSSVV